MTMTMFEYNSTLSTTACGAIAAIVNSAKDQHHTALYFKLAREESDLINIFGKEDVTNALAALASSYVGTDSELLAHYLNSQVTASDKALEELKHEFETQKVVFRKCGQFVHVVTHSHEDSQYPYQVETFLHGSGALNSCRLRTIGDALKNLVTPLASKLKQAEIEMFNKLGY